MLTLFNTNPSAQSLEDRILAMTDYAVRVTVPEKLHESGIFDESEIDQIVSWLIAYRDLHHLTIIE